MRTLSLLFAMVLALPPAPVHAQTESSASFDRGYDLIRLCESRDTLDRGLCLGTFLGLTGGSQVTAPRTQRLRFCEPDGVLLGERRDIVLQYIHENPERGHLPGATLFYEALAELFPGPRARPRGVMKPPWP